MLLYDPVIDWYVWPLYSYSNTGVTAFDGLLLSVPVFSDRSKLTTSACTASVHLALAFASCFVIKDEMKTMAMPTNENIIGAKNLPMGPELDLVVTLIFLPPVYTFRPAFRNFFVLCHLIRNYILHCQLFGVFGSFPCVSGNIMGKLSP